MPARPLDAAFGPLVLHMAVHAALLFSTAGHWLPLSAGPPLHRARPARSWYLLVMPGFVKPWGFGRASKLTHGVLL